MRAETGPSSFLKDVMEMNAMSAKLAHGLEGKHCFQILSVMVTGLSSVLPLCLVHPRKMGRYKMGRRS